MNIYRLALLGLILIGCADDIRQPDNPLTYGSELVPADRLVHKGILSPDLREFYFTISDKTFENFDIYRVSKLESTWSDPIPAAINSEYDDHGMSFSPDGKSLFFSSTRPATEETLSGTWHLWKSNQKEDGWSDPKYVDIPNLRDKLTSHPSISTHGNLYFHASNPDYTEMDVYLCKPLNGGYGEAKKVQFEDRPSGDFCTPFVSPNEDYLIFARVGKQLELWIAHSKGSPEKWGVPIRLGDTINDQNQGNPFVTPDQKYLFFTSGKGQDGWRIKQVRIDAVLGAG